MQRNIFADRIKGYACFLVVFGHVIMGVRLSGVDIPKIFYGAEKFIWSFHVALFLFMSGFVYSLTGERGRTKRAFLLHKLINLGIPYITFSAVYIIINSFVPGVNTHSALSDILLIWKEPVAQYWFLYALFFLFLIWTVFSGFLKNWQITALFTLVNFLAAAFRINLGIFTVSVNSAFAFGLGTFVSIAFAEKCGNLTKIIVIALHIMLGAAAVRFNLTEAAGVKEVLIAAGIFASIMLISAAQKNHIAARALDFLSRYSFQIYLLHTIFTAAVRILLIRVGITGWAVHVAVGCAAGIGFSWIAAWIAEKSRFLNFFFFPAATVKKLHAEKGE